MCSIISVACWAAKERERYCRRLEQTDLGSFTGKYVTQSQKQRAGDLIAARHAL